MPTITKTITNAQLKTLDSSYVELIPAPAQTGMNIRVNNLSLSVRGSNVPASPLSDAAENIRIWSALSLLYDLSNESRYPLYRENLPDEYAEVDSWWLSSGIFSKTSDLTISDEYPEQPVVYQKALYLGVVVGTSSESTFYTAAGYDSFLSGVDNKTIDIQIDYDYIEGIFDDAEVQSLIDNAISGLSGGGGLNTAAVNRLITTAIDQLLATTPQLVVPNGYCAIADVIARLTGEFDFPTHEQIQSFIVETYHQINVALAGRYRTPVLEGRSPITRNYMTRVNALGAAASSIELQLTSVGQTPARRIPYRVEFEEELDKFNSISFPDLPRK